MTKTSRRPKWAKNLSKSTWRDLQGCQGRKTPTLAQLRRDVEWQDSNGVKCHTCLAALANAN